jgi:hypothetical protein
MKFELSEFNINFGFKDKDHIELLKKQIEAGYELPIDVYEESGIYKIIDGGHAWMAYQELGREPKNVRVLTFKDDAEKIAYSRHKNINRLQQTPVTYTKSIFQELKLRLGVETDQQVISILRRLYNLKNPNKQLKENDEDKTYHNVVVGVFKGEPITWESFAQHNLDYLDFPLWLAELVDSQKLKVAHANALMKLNPDETLMKRIADFVIETEKNAKETNQIVEDVLRLKNKTGGPKRSLISYSHRGFFGDNEFSGNASGWLLVDLILLYKPKKVFDPMEGSGTSRDVCRIMDIEYEGGDIYSDEHKFDVLTNEVPVNDLTFFHPPYWNIIDYSKAFSEFLKKEIPPEENDLSQCPTFADYMEKLFFCIDKLLKKCKRLAILIGDVTRGTEFLSPQAGIIWHYNERVEDCWIKEQLHEYARYRYEQQSFVPHSHEYVIIMKGDLYG